MVKKEDNHKSDLLSDKIENLTSLLDVYKKEASQDIRLDLTNFEDNFNRADLVLKWLDKSIVWKKTVDASKSTLSKVIANLNDKYTSDALYNITEKSLRSKVEANDEYQLYKKQFFYAELIYDYCVEIQSILKSQQFEIKNRFEYMKFVNGLDR